MLRIATEGRKGLEVCDIELTMPRPSYTINTLQTLARLYPESDFRLIIGSDNMLVFDRWKDHELIMERFLYRAAKGARSTVCCLRVLQNISKTIIFIPEQYGNIAQHQRHSLHRSL